MIAGVADTGNQFVSPLSITSVCKPPFHTETYPLVANLSAVSLTTIRKQTFVVSPIEKNQKD